jgi:GAF domain-containing protein
VDPTTRDAAQLNEPADQQVQASWLVELQELLLASDSLAEFLRELAVLAARATASETSCGVTLRPDGQPATVASSDDLALRVDEIQYAAHAGPCLHSLRDGNIVHIADLMQEKRWPEFTSNALAHGVRSSMSVPLTGHFGIVGVLNLYAPQPHVYDEAAQRRATVFAATASGAVAVARRIAEQAQLTEDLRTALSNRSVIDQAIGILMAQSLLSAQAAFEVLRRASHTRNIKIREVAARLIESVTGAPPTGQVRFEPRS